MKNQVSENPDKNRDFNYLTILSALMVACYLTSNIMAVKIINIGGITSFDPGTITFPLAYMLGDVLTEIWGFKTSKKVIYLTFICNIFLVVFTLIGVYLPSPDYMSEINIAYSTIFTYTPRILLASFIAFIIGEISNAWFMEKIKYLTNEKFLFVRTILSSAIGYALDTVLFVLVGYIGSVPFKDIISMIIIQYIAKMLIEIICSTPLSYGFIIFLKKKLGIRNARS